MDDFEAYAKMITNQLTCTREKDGTGCDHCIVHSNIVSAMYSIDKSSYSKGKESVRKQVQIALSGLNEI
jgi:hypothetical protein